MCIVRVETMRALQYLILLVSVVALVRSGPPSSISYTCSNTGVELTKDADLIHVAIPTGSVSNRTYCRPKNKQLDPCKNNQNKLSMSLLYEEESTNSVIGGKTFRFYKLACISQPMNVTRNSTIYTAISEPTNEKAETNNGFSLLLKKDNQAVSEVTSLKIGDKLQLQMTGKDVEISPISCIAYPVDDKKHNVTIWKLRTGLQDDKNCVNEDPAIVETPKWSQITKLEPSIRINIFAFRFLTSPKVAIECTATICAKGDHGGCKQTCVTIKGRKRRSIEQIVKKDNAKHIGSASVSFAVTENNSFANSSPGLSAGFMMVATVGVVLAFLL